MKINHEQLSEINPVKHQHYILESAKQWRRVCPIQLNRVGYRVGSPIEEKFVDFTVGDYFVNDAVAALY
jgi:very-short-patch-repair endonuclease